MTIYRQPADQKHGPNCGPTSVAVLTANPLADVMAFIKADCRKGPNWKGSTHNRGGRFGGENADCFKALKHFGANPKVESRWEKQYAGRQLRSVIAELPTSRAYFICTGGHAQAVVGDRVFDQSTSVEGDHISSYWGRNKKVNVIISVDRLTDNSTEENIVSNPVAVIPLSLSNSVIQVAEFEAVAAQSVETAKLATANKNTAKVNAYAHLIAGLVAHKVRKGTAQAGEFKAALIEHGVSKACAKRYLRMARRPRRSLGSRRQALTWTPSWQRSKRRVSRLSKTWSTSSRRRSC